MFTLQHTIYFDRNGWKKHNWTFYSCLNQSLMRIEYIKTVCDLECFLAALEIEGFSPPPKKNGRKKRIEFKMKAYTYSN